MYTYESSKLFENVVLYKHVEAIVLQRSRSKRIIWEPTAIKGKLKELQEKGVLGQYKLNYKFNESESINEVLVKIKKIHIENPYLY